MPPISSKAGLFSSLTTGWWRFRSKHFDFSATFLDQDRSLFMFSITSISQGCVLTPCPIGVNHQLPVFCHHDSVFSTRLPENPEDVITFFFFYKQFHQIILAWDNSIRAWWPKIVLLRDFLIDLSCECVTGERRLMTSLHTNKPSCVTNVLALRKIPLSGKASKRLNSLYLHP